MAPPEPIEADEAIAPLVILYALGATAGLAAVLAWAHWFRGYA